MRVRKKNEEKVFNNIKAASIKDWKSFHKKSIFNLIKVWKFH